MSRQCVGMDGELVWYELINGWVELHVGTHSLPPRGWIYLDFMITHASRDQPVAAAEELVSALCLSC
jgi:hypothetical protein